MLRLVIQDQEFSEGHVEPKLLGVLTNGTPEKIARTHALAGQGCLHCLALGVREEF